MTASTATRNRGRRDRNAPLRRKAARLAAVQALYQMELSGDPVEQVLHQFLEERLGEALDGLDLGQADRNLFTALVRGVASEQGELDDMLAAVLNEDWPLERLEKLLAIVLRGGTYELSARPEVPARVIISEYVHLTDAFFGGKEPSLVNGVLDRLARALRPEEFEHGKAPPGA